MTDKYLRIDIRSKDYSKKRVLSDIQLDIDQGEVIAIMGQSGSGKTTLARCLAGFEEYEGEIFLDGRDISKMHPKDRSIGIVPQDGALFPHLNVEQNVGFGIKGKKGRSEKVREFLSLVKLEDIENTATKKVDQISGGQQQRVAVARAMAGNPKVIILDESFSALDQWLRISVRRQILESLKSVNCTVIVITHDVNEAFELADRVAVIQDGKLVQFDTSDNLYLCPNSLSVAQLVGIANVVNYDEEIYGTGFKDFSQHSEVSGNVKVLMSRPEDVVSLDAGIGTPTRIAATIESIKSSGPTKHIYLTIDKTGEPIISTDEFLATQAVGESVEIGISSEGIIYESLDKIISDYQSHW